MCVRAVMPGTKLQEHTGSEKAWVYSTVDFADEEQKPELFCIRFASIEREAAPYRIHLLPCVCTCWFASARLACMLLLRAEEMCAANVCAGAQEFKKAFEEAMVHNEKLLAEDEAAAESRGEETPAETAAKESSAKVPTHGSVLCSLMMGLTLSLKRAVATCKKRRAWRCPWVVPGSRALLPGSAVVACMLYFSTAHTRARGCRVAVVIAFTAVGATCGDVVL